MIRYHGILDVSVVSLLLLLCFSHSGLCKNCNFTYSPLVTTSTSEIIKNLKEFLLLDYPVSVPSNLKSDKFCFELWQLHFIYRELSRLIQVAGFQLRQNISRLEEILNLKELFQFCEIESDCVDFERTNISVFLDSIHSNLKKMAAKLEPATDQNPTDFSSCTSVQCQADSLSTPYPGYSSQMLEITQTSRSAILRRHHWLLLLIPLLVCLFSVVKCSGRIPVQPLPLQL
ncbi:uncharacterized protein LOC129340248 [Eublepharis macularius]|uniref:Uncharacterized protein LOC129340248 n=1 Tax=Eublepharis macularius TaxID=481883 RepID=A0AA97K8I8_EUBMA|nr:uncharacterized protein LOC129340248 [Eublepharis macularius]XP_054850897.1 uncharacterized protein LOC129340248 [Eublepharis macularius]